MNSKEKKEDDWDNIIEELKIFQGTLKDFCKIKKISKSSLYYQRKNRNLINENTKAEPKVSFTKIDIKEPESQDKKDLSVSNEQNKKLNNIEMNNLDNTHNNTIKVEIGKAKIIIDSTDKNTLSFIMKELSLIC